MAGFLLRKDSKRRPLRMAKELAEEFGLNQGQLGKILAKDPLAPKPLIRTRGFGSRQGRTYYDPIEVRTWWAARNKSQSA